LPSKRGGRFGLRFNLSFKARCALRLGEGPRAFGFSILIFCRCRGICACHAVALAKARQMAIHQSRRLTQAPPQQFSRSIALTICWVAIGNRKPKIEIALRV
jgi:hypothetical protein